MKSHILELDWIDPCEAFSHVAALPYALFLDSADQGHQDARYSFIATHPFETIEAKDGMVTVTNSRQQTTFEADPFTIVKERLAAWGFPGEKRDDLPPFQGGAAGLFGYDLGRTVEKMPDLAKADRDLPEMAIGIYDRIIAFDHERKKAWIIVHAEDEATAIKKQNFLRSIVTTPPSPFAEAENSHWTKSRVDGGVQWTENFTEDGYKRQIQKVIDYICAGDIFQANLSQRFDAALPAGFDSFAHYKLLREVNPAPFATYMNLGNVRISSASPERFLTVRNGHVQAKPIKGTKVRLINANDDEQQKKNLQSSEKDRAENIMIVDLMRNDLSRACMADSVNVEKLCAVETFARVHHLVSTITGRLKEECTPVDLLRACFPGGSVTGAPKIRAMEIIEELEPTQRGPYCGCIGYVGFNGSMDLNILIRTLVYKGSAVSFQTGGGITSDSKIDAEYQETLDKAAAIFASFGSGEKVRKTG